MKENNKCEADEVGARYLLAASLAVPFIGVQNQFAVQKQRQVKPTASRAPSGQNVRGAQVARVASPARAARRPMPVIVNAPAIDRFSWMVN